MIVYCVNDGAVMKAWEKDQFKEAGIKEDEEDGTGFFKFFADTRGEFSKALDMVMDHPGPLAAQRWADRYGPRGKEDPGIVELVDEHGLAFCGLEKSLFPEGAALLPRAQSRYVWLQDIVEHPAAYTSALARGLKRSKLPIANPSRMSMLHVSSRRGR